MASPPFNINQALPGDTDVVSQHPANARTFRDVTESYLNTDHDFNTGHHNWAALVEQAGNPGAVANTGFVYTKDVAGATELFWEDHAGNVKQITAGGKINVVATDIPVNSVDGTKIALGSDTVGDIMYYNGTDWVRLPAGTSGQVLRSNGAAAPSWATPTTVIFSVEFVSADTSFSNGSLTTFPHSLGVIPKLVKLELVCTVGDAGYSAGHILQLAGAADLSSGNQGISLQRDNTNVYVVVASGGITIINRSGFGVAVVNAANWNLRVTAWA